MWPSSRCVPSAGLDPGGGVRGLVRFPQQLDLGRRRQGLRPIDVGLCGDARLGLALGRAQKLGGPPDVFRQQGEAFRMFGGGVQLGVGQFGFRADDGLAPHGSRFVARRINLLEFGQHVDALGLTAP